MVSQIRVPFRISSSGYVDTSTDDSERLSYSVMSLISTRLGERLMRGEYGSGVPDQVFDNLVATFGNTPEQTIESEANKAIAAYLPALQIIDVAVDQAAGSPTEYRVTIRYTLDTDKVDRTTTVTVTRDLLTGN